MYRDGSNWKTGAQVTFAGRITRDEISMILNARYDDRWFIPGQVGMTDLQDGWDSQLDHPFHEICGFALTLAAPEIGKANVWNPVTQAQLVRRSLVEKKTDKNKRT